MDTYVHITAIVHVRTHALDCARTFSSAKLCMYVHRNWGLAMRLASVRDLGLYVRDRRRRLGMTQTDLSTSAQVSQRWLSDLEAGKPTAEVGLVFKVLHALELTLEALPAQAGHDDVDLDDILRAHAQPGLGETTHD